MRVRKPLNFVTFCHADCSSARHRKRCLKPSPSSGSADPRVMEELGRAPAFHHSSCATCSARQCGMSGAVQELQRLEPRKFRNLAVTKAFIASVAGSPREFPK